MPDFTTLPVSRTYARCASDSAWVAFCSTSSTVVPCSLISLMIEKINAISFGARPIDGSSSSSNRGRLISARPIASICCSPPDRVPPACLRRSASRGNSENTRSRSSWRISLYGYAPM